MLCDFGLSRTNCTTENIDSEKENVNKILTPRVQNKYYGAPEVVVDNSTHYDEKVDIYSAGCVIMQLLELFEHDTRKQKYDTSATSNENESFEFLEEYKDQEKPQGSPTLSKSSLHDQL